MSPPDDSENTRNPQFDRQKFRHGLLKEDYERLKSEVSNPNIDLKSLQSKINNMENRLRGFLASEREYRARFTAHAGYKGESTSRLLSTRGMLSSGLKSMRKTLAEREAALRQQKEAERQQRESMREALRQQKVEETERKRQERESQKEAFRQQKEAERQQRESQKEAFRQRREAERQQKESMRETLRQQKTEQAEANRIQKEQRSVLLSRSGMAVSAASGVFKGGTNKEVKDMLSELKRIRADLEKELNTPGVQGSPLLKHRIESHLGLLSGAIGEGASSSGFMGTVGRLLGRFGGIGVIAALAGKAAWGAAKLPNTINGMVQGIASAAAPATDYIRQTSQIGRLSGTSGAYLRRMFGSIDVYTGKGGASLLEQRPAWMGKYLVSQLQAAKMLSDISSSGALVTGKFDIAHQIARSRNPQNVFAGLPESTIAGLLGQFRVMGTTGPTTRLGRFAQSRFGSYFNNMMAFGMNKGRALSLFEAGYNTLSANSVTAVDPNMLQSLISGLVKTGIPAYRTPGGISSAISSYVSGAERTITNPGLFSAVASYFPGLFGTPKEAMGVFRQMIGMAHIKDKKTREDLLRGSRYISGKKNIFERRQWLESLMMSYPGIGDQLGSIIGPMIPGFEDIVASRLGTPFLVSVMRNAGVKGYKYPPSGTSPLGMSASYTKALNLGVAADTTSLEAGINALNTLGVIVGNLAPTIDNLNRTIIMFNTNMEIHAENLVHSAQDLVHAITGHHLPTLPNIPPSRGGVLVGPGARALSGGTSSQ